MTALLNTTYRKSMLATLCAGLMLCASCTDEDMVQTPNQSNQISFATSMSDEWNKGEARSVAKKEKTFDAYQFENSDLWLITTTEANIDTTCHPASLSRGAATTSENFKELHETFGVRAYTYTGNSWADATDAKIYANENVTWNNGTWNYTPTRFWPGADYQMKFFAYAPESINPTINNKQIVVSHTVNSDVSQQEDLLLAIHDGIAGDTNGTFNLKFEHILTAVKVKVAAGMKGTIKSISFNNIKSQGSHSFTEDEEIWTTSASEHSTCDDVWSSSSVPRAYGLDITIGQLDGSEVMLADGENTFMMIPQKLNDDAELVVIFDNGTTEGLELRGNLAGKVWPIGHTVTYTISNTGIEWEFNVPDEIVFDYFGGTKSFQVESYVVSTNSEKSPVPWTAEFVVENEEQRKWVTEFPTSEDGSVDIQNYSAKARQQKLHNSHSEWLWAPERVNKGTSDAPHNLSNATGGETVENTANCYIVNGPGTYKFPVVYGNAIKNGETNKDAYQHSSANHVLSTFINHAGTKIADPWIASNKCAPNGVKIIWQDAQDLVTDIKLEGTSPNYYITFKVEKEFIQQGNAVIAVLQENTVLWSWHIWVTDYVPLEEKPSIDAYDPEKIPELLMKDRKVETSNGGRTYIFMGPLLGWCYEGKYPAREVKVRFTQVGTGTTKDVTIKQKEFIIGNHAPTYQWGRKDPIISGNGVQSMKNKYYYNSAGECSDILDIGTGWGSSTANIQTCIQNPGKFCLNFEMDGRYVNLWDMNTSQGYDVYATHNTGKTIYDPSPVGYKVPSNDAFSGFTLNGQDINHEYNHTPFSLSICNTPYSKTGDFKNNAGWVFYCNNMTVKEKDPSGGVIYFPTVNSRWHESGGFWGGNPLTYWTAHSHPTTLTTALVMYMQATSFWRKDLGYMRGHSFAVRPIREL